MSDSHPTETGGWYYAAQGNPVGPMEDAAFQALVRAGTIRPETMVWRNGWAEWKPWREASLSVADGADASHPHGTCHVCGRTFPTGDMMFAGGAWVCSGCKPAYVETMKTHGTTLSKFAYGGFWIRTAAVIIDGILTSMMQYAVYIPLFVIGFRQAIRSDLNPEPSATGALAMVAIQLIAYAIGILLAAVYEIWMVGRYGATVGKMACGLRVVRADGSRIGYGRATGRHFAKYVSAIILYGGFIMAAFTDEKRALHDMMCDTRVVKK